MEWCPTTGVYRESLVGWGIRIDVSGCKRSVVTGLAKGNEVVPGKKSLLLDGVIELRLAARALFSRARMGARLL
jgi:hypothetical protein